MLGARDGHKALLGDLHHAGLDRRRRRQLRLRSSRGADAQARRELSREERRAGALHAARPHRRVPLEQCRRQASIPFSEPSGSVSRPVFRHARAGPERQGRRVPLGGLLHHQCHGRGRHRGNGVAVRGGIAILNRIRVLALRRRCDSRPPSRACRRQRRRIVNRTGRRAGAGQAEATLGG